jgi:hypothetical protein
VQGVTMFESWLVNKEMGKMPIKGFEDAKDGSWFGSYKVDNADIWAKVKSGEFQGFSVEGIFGYSDIVKKEDIMLEKIKEILRIAEI